MKNENEKNVKFGLLGHNISHSFSPRIHSLLGEYSYELFDLDKEDAKKFLLNKDFRGINITIPYKVMAMDYCDEVEEVAKKLGCINTIVNRNGKLYGYNTDYLGLKYTLEYRNIEVKNKNILIVGNGATAKVSRIVCENLGAKKVINIGRSNDIKFHDYPLYKDANVLINATPLGTYPNNYDIYPVDIEKLKELESIFDLNYNPRITNLLYRGRKLNLNTASGLLMLVAQAKYSSEYFNDSKIDDGKIIEVHDILSKTMTNIAVVGMPGCGKSTISSLLAKKLDLLLVDIDIEVKKEKGLNSEDYINKFGIDKFRNLEANIIKREGSLYNRVIATGGGSILDEVNRYALFQNSLIFYIDRDLDKLDIKGRPLSQGGIDTLRDLYSKRDPLYKEIMDYRIDNNGNIEDSLEAIIDIYEKHISDKWT